MQRIQRPIWYHDYYQDSRGQLNLSNNICHDTVLIKNIPTRFNYLSVFCYPDAAKTYNEIAELHGVDATHIAIGFGAGDIVFRVLNMLKQYTVGIVTPTYDLAYTFAVNLGINVVSSNYVDDLTTDVLYIANPNGVTGKALSQLEILELATKYKYIIVDEAYGDFCFQDFSVLSNSTQCSNIIVIKTFSKTIASPGVRFGYCISSDKIIQELQETRSSTVVTGFISELVPQLIKQIPSHIDRMIETREYIENRYDCVPSQGNYVLFKNDPTIDCKLKQTPHGLFRMALTDIKTFKKLENDR